ncbi:Flp family type IVb pilin [Mesorhizobium sp.]|uniref:Flp family type IVb pilin n=1 Tax=Mesorhizobium sp. TaxID=1871066 RepID=UPI0011FBAB94|nr:Flp family type IVb pilin [Mesorhizobium sp.]TIO62932.1 MAG: Flp family type IVb pilin [Mesorhizobium sp.]
MKKLLSVYKQFAADENGAAMVEYSILIGIIAVAAIGFIIGIGMWVTGRFSGLCAAMQASNVGTCATGAGS